MNLFKMKNKILLVILLILYSIHSIAQNKSDVSLFYKKDSIFLNQISSKSGDLFKELGHHGPAIENEWLALRMYFDKRTAIDVYSKQKPGLELFDYKWYPSAHAQKNGAGADYYKAGETIGLGGVRLWDGEKIVPLNPVTNRTARVVKEANSTYMEMLSQDVPYKGAYVDILVRVTVFSGFRQAKVEAWALTDEKVQFVTGINYHQDQQVRIEDDYMITWGLHPEDITNEKVEVGAAIVFNPDDFNLRFKDQIQYLLVSKPTKFLSSWITSANAKESQTNDFGSFEKIVIELSNDIATKQ